jgi:hypothetical protein
VHNWSAVCHLRFAFCGLGREQPSPFNSTRRLPTPNALPTKESQLSARRTMSAIKGTDVRTISVGGGINTRWSDIDKSRLYCIGTSILFSSCGNLRLDARLACLVSLSSHAPTFNLHCRLCNVLWSSRSTTSIDSSEDQTTSGCKWQSNNNNKHNLTILIIWTSKHTTILSWPQCSVITSSSSQNHLCLSARVLPRTD